ncbi:M1 family aminopeptidase [Stigmatella sp. ncwal1]|uniref:M1 family aminopeptidase n=1 Tax=Stigmatella ashevillensis TaxID=2995309 RepID=A0ABT5DFH4_9BACT|nr:M1 family aminopeptidase [Stigmatella ashevillena]MDC0712358.1 M1 family aminopeptidase [Stigmatella ashevillena]
MNLPRLATVARTEWSHQLRRPLFWMLLVLLVAVVWGVTSGNVTITSGNTEVGGKKAWVTNEFALAQTVILLTFLLFSFFVSVSAGMAVISDSEARVQPLLHTTPLTPTEYVWGKFLAVLGTYVLALGVMMGLLAFFHHAVPPGDAAEFRGPFVLGNYVRTAVWFGLPLLVFTAGAAFAVGERTRQPVPVFFLPVGLFFLCAFFLWDWSPGWLDPRVNRFLMAVEPAGFRWLTETWLKVDRGVDFYNTQPVVLDALFVISRLVLVGLGLGAVAWSERHFRRVLREEEGGRPSRAAQRRTEAPPAPVALSHAGVPLSALGMGARQPGFWKGLWTVTRAEARGLLSQPGLYLFLPLLLLQMVSQAATAVGPFDTELLLVPGRFAVSSMGAASLLVSLLLMFYTVESLERERACGFASLHDAAPVRTLSVLLGKALANSLVVVLLLTAMGLAGTGVQISQGTVPLTLMPYLLVWGLLLTPTFLMWTGFILAARAVTGGRFGTYALGLSALGLTGGVALSGHLTWVTNWPLWGAVLWTDLGAFQADRLALVLNRVAALGMAAFFIALAVRLDGRRARDSVTVLEALKPSALGRSAWRLAPYAVVPAVALIWVGILVAQGHQGAAAKHRAKQYWQKNLATWKDAPQPALVDVDLDVDLEPEASAFRTQGTYTLRNRQDTPLARFALTGSDSWEDVRWTVEGQDVTPEDRAGLYVFTPSPPLAPGATLKVGFAFHGHEPRGVSRKGGALREFILPSGVVLTSFEPTFAPVVGYQEERGVDPKENRYEPRVYPDDHYLGPTSAAWGTGTPFTTRIRLSAPEAYTLNSVGVRESDTVKDGRRTTVWHSDHPVSLFNIVAGKWDRVDGEGTVVFHHPAHGYNVKEMSRGLDAARRYYSEWFYPFPWDELKLSEFAGLVTSAQGFPTDITFSESIGFLTRPTPEVNTVLLVTAHEVAHQWWGNLLIPGKGPGGEVLSEGMSHYSALKLIEQLDGTEARAQTARRLEERYAKERRVDGERPLVKLDGSREGDTVVLYEKGGWMFWMLEEVMGRPAMHAGLQAFLRRYMEDADHPVLQDFLAVMRSFAPDAAAFDDFTRQAFFEVAVPEYHVTGTHVAKEGAQWLTTATVKNVGTGRWPLEVAVVKGSRGMSRPDGAKEEQPPVDFHEARERVVLGAGEEAHVTVRSDFAPERWVVDPDVRVLQLRRDHAWATLSAP